MRNDEQTAALSRRVLEACEKHKFPNEAAWGRALLGIAQARSGHTTEGVELIRQGIAGLLAVDSPIGVPFLIRDLAEAQYLDGATTEALVTVKEALQFNPEDCVNRPEILRLCGELHFESGQPDLAEADFRG